MPSVLKFTALTGATRGGPQCYLLDVDGYRLLLDCGWTEPFDPSVLAPLQRCVSRARNGWQWR
jgi:cleavage and polyadenylation specificity factor subunit 2